MLKNQLCHIQHTGQSDGAFSVLIKLNEDHPIFKGHFPGQPVLPGACMLQMVKEIVRDYINQSITLKKASNLKFIAPVDPRLTDELELKVQYKPLDSGFAVTASMQANGVVCFKLQAVFG